MGGMSRPRSEGSPSPQRYQRFLPIRECASCSSKCSAPGSTSTGEGEGRDIGSVVFPDADVKVFLDASPEVRARRRSQQTGESLEEVLVDLNRRDRLDSTRQASPLTVPDGAVVVDTSALTFEEVVQRLLALIRAKS